jgi:hypothetical protein
VVLLVGVEIQKDKQVDLNSSVLKPEIIIINFMFSVFQKGTQKNSYGRIRMETKALSERCF